MNAELVIAQLLPHFREEFVLSSHNFEVIDGKGMVNIVFKVTYPNQKETIVKYYPPLLSKENAISDSDPNNTTNTYKDDINWSHRKDCEVEDLRTLASFGVNTPNILRVADTFIEIEYIQTTVPSTTTITSTTTTTNTTTTPTTASTPISTTDPTNKYTKKTQINWSHVLKDMTKWYSLTEKKATSENKQIFGYHRDSYYGNSRLQNGWYSDWWEYFGKTRFDPVLQELAIKFPDWELLPVAVFIRENMHFLGQPVRSVLLHGDLFKNNILSKFVPSSPASASSASSIYFIDPTCFYGDEYFDYAKLHSIKSKTIKNHPRRTLYNIYYAFHYYWITNGQQAPSWVRPPLEEMIRSFIPELLKLIPEKGFKMLGGLIAWKGKEFDVAMESNNSNSTSSSNSYDIGLIYVGAFNPPHPNHLGMLQRARAPFDGTKKFLPVFICSPTWYLHKKEIPQRHILSVSQRQKLLQQGLPEQSVIVHYVVDHKLTFAVLSAAFPTTELYCVCGSEGEVRRKVYNPAFIEQTTPLVVVERFGHPIIDEEWNITKRIVKFVKGTEEKWSSTMLRERADLITPKSD